MNKNLLKRSVGVSFIASLVTLTACDLTGGTGGAGGGTPPDPTLFTCECECHTGADTSTSAEDVCGTSLLDVKPKCDSYCAKVEEETNTLNGGSLYSTICTLQNAVPTEMKCPPEMAAKALDSWGTPDSTDATLDRRVSTATIIYYRQHVGVPVGGEVTFTGGCERGSCLMSFSQIRLSPGDFAVYDSGTGEDMKLTNLTLLNVGPISATQVDGIFTIPRGSIQVLVEGEVNGVRQALSFSPDQDIQGYYMPGEGTFTLSADLFSGTDFGLRFDLANDSLRRPPVADAGDDQSVTLPPRDSTVTVTLDGGRSSDPDGDLDHIDWFEGATYLGRGLTLQYAFPGGEHTVTAIAFDRSSKMNADKVTVSVR